MIMAVFVVELGWLVALDFDPGVDTGKPIA
jgi:hypothetical protein